MERLTFDEVLHDLIEDAAEDESLRVQRQGDILTVSSGIIGLIGSERDMWSVVRAIPMPLPDGDGSWSSHWGGCLAFKESKSFADLFDVTGKPTTLVKPTNVVIDHDPDVWRISARAMCAGDHYEFVDNDYWPLLENCPELWHTVLRKGVGPIWGDRGDIRVMVMPLDRDEIDASHLKPLTDS